MRTIYKYPLRPGLNTVSMHFNAHRLHVGDQDGVPTLWAQVNTDEPLVEQVYEVFGTGQPLPEHIGYMEHVGTAVGPLFVWHVYRRLVS